jgi:predicted MFS family arabinose efflux permease
MVVANVLLAVGLVPLLAFDDASRVWIAYVVVLYEARRAVLHAGPCRSSRTWSTARPLTANALNSQNSNIARLVGAALGGVAAGVGSVTVVTIVDGATFAVAAVLIALVRAPFPTSTRPGRAAAMLAE